MTERTGGTERRHPIGVVAERTGLTPDVLRVWERRYGVVAPTRSAGGQRLYTDAEVERLRLLHRATLGGRSIGRVAGLTTVELADLVREDEAARARAPGRAPQPGVLEADAYLERGMDRVREFDQHGLESLLRRASAALSVPRFLEELAAPFARQVGQAWHDGWLTAAQEHAATVVLRRVLEEGMDALQPSSATRLLVVATPAGERHEIGAFLVAAAALGEGWRVLYLGSDLPAADIAQAAVTRDARAVAVSAMYAPEPARLLEELRGLRDRLPADVMLLAGGAAVEGLAEELEGEGVLAVLDLAALRGMLQAEIEGES